LFVGRNTMPKEDKATKVRITDQFRDKTGMVYELNCQGVKMSISMMSSNRDAERDAEWQAEATAKVLPAPIVARGSGPSRDEAFRVLRDAWGAHRDANTCPMLDWEGIREALTAVRAL
jgi:hypothetical protein